MRGKVERVVAGDGFGPIVGQDGEECFFPRSALKGVAFAELGPGGPAPFRTLEAKADAPASNSVRSTSDSPPRRSRQSTRHRWRAAR